MNENKKIEQLKQQGWEGMSSLLDVHMPEGKPRSVAWWYWLAGAAAVLLALAIPVTFLLNEDASDTSLFVTQDKVFRTEEQNSFIADDKKEMNSQSAPSEEIAGISSEKVLDDLVEQKRIIPAFDTKLANRDRMHETNVIYDPKKSGDDEKIADGSVQAASKEPYGNMVAEDVIQSNGRPIDGNLSQLFYQIEDPKKSLTSFVTNSPNRIEISKFTRKIKVSVFSEVIWSVTDHFGFVNVGPGVHYGLGNWAVGLSGGLSVPLPRQKSFYTSNLPFSNQYNFSSARPESHDMSITSNKGSVYYEKYSMKPGFVFGLSVQRQLFSHWGLGFDLGRIGFRYNFTQKAEPNQNIAASTDLRNLQNSFWYGGLSVNYSLGERWLVHGGVKFINVLHAGEVGLMPSIRMEYGF